MIDIVWNVENKGSIRNIYFQGAVLILTWDSKLTSIFYFIRYMFGVEYTRQGQPVQTSRYERENKPMTLIRHYVVHFSIQFVIILPLFFFLYLFDNTPGE